MRVRPNKQQLEELILGQEAFLAAMNGVLDEESDHDAVLRAVVLTSGTPVINRIKGLDPARVYHEREIERLCIKYRLRFLDGRWYKGELPQQVFHALRQLESRTNVPLAGFKVLAPASHFKLTRCEGDPLLFLRVGEQHHYLVHQWGGHLAKYRAALYWPLRSMRHLVITVLAIAVVLALAVPTGWIADAPSASWFGAHRLLFLFWSVTVCASFTAFSWFTFQGTTSADAWRSHRVN